VTDGGSSVCWGAVEGDSDNKQVVLAQSSDTLQCTLDVKGRIACRQDSLAFSGSYKDLWVNGGIACAIDVAGAAECNGFLGKNVPLVKAKAIQLQRDAVVCELTEDNEVLCWSHLAIPWPPSTPAPRQGGPALMFPLPAGKYGEVALGTQNVCGREATTGDVKCYAGDGNVPW
jgi:hypothetical protein